MTGSRLGSRLCIPDILWAGCRKLRWGMLGFLTAIFWAHKITNYNGSFSPTHPNCWLGSQFQAPDTPYTNRQRSPAKKKARQEGRLGGLGWELKKHPANEQQMPDYTLQPGSPGSASQDVLSHSSPISPSPSPSWALPPSSHQLLQLRAAPNSTSSFKFALILSSAPSMGVLDWRKMPARGKVVISSP